MSGPLRVNIIAGHLAGADHETNDGEKGRLISGVFPKKHPRTFVPQATPDHRLVHKRDIPAYENFISDNLLDLLKANATDVSGVPGLKQVGGQGSRGLENTEGLFFLCSLYEAMKGELHEVLAQRVDDRVFLDNRARACYEFNESVNVDYLDPSYDLIIGHEDAKGRVVVGPKSEHFSGRTGYHGKKVEPLPAFLQGPHVTLFGPPDSAQICVESMNCAHTKLPNEPTCVTELLAAHSSTPKWGADHEDSKTPLHADLVEASSNLSACFEGSLPGICAEKRSQPIKRLPGLALPTNFLLYNGQPLPMHVYDFALHVSKHWNNPAALTFYMPKLESEEEACYLSHLFAAAENMLQKLHPSYKVGTIRVIVVVENARLLYRINEIIDELHPFFAGVSLGWHDLLASTARLFKEDPNYRMPVKADPNIVTNSIVGAHHLLADVVGARGGIKIGGMYGVLPVDENPASASFQVTMKGFIRDVVTQLKRNLDGFWVARPDFIRIGMALVEAFKLWKSGNKGPMTSMVTSLLQEQYHKEVLDFIAGDDVRPLNADDPMYKRSLLAVHSGISSVIANNHPEEVRYNVFQSLQYMADWLSGNGNVALPSSVGGVPVRVLDDLATTERSRWEVWLEIHHGRFGIEDFVGIAHEELDFIRKDQSTETKIVQVKWSERTAKWYPVAFKIMMLLMTKAQPVEFVTELMLPFTADEVRSVPDAWEMMHNLDPKKYSLDAYVERLTTYYAICPSVHFSKTMAQNIVLDLGKAKECFQLLSSEDLRHPLSTTNREMVWNQVLTRLRETPGAKLHEQIAAALAKNSVNGATMTITSGPGKRYENIAVGVSEIGRLPVSEETRFEVASLSKSVGSCFAVNYFEKRGIPLTTKVNELLATTSSSYRIPSGDAAHPNWGDDTTIAQCMSHSALNMHYVNGIPLKDPVPPITEMMVGNDKYQYVPVCAPKEPGSAFGYSGGGHMMIEHLIEALEGKSIVDLTQPFFEQLGMTTFTFHQKNQPGVSYATAYTAEGQAVEGGRQMHPAFAAGGLGTARDMAVFLNELTDAYQNENYKGAITHSAAARMLFGEDLGSQEFMGAYMGLGIFIAEAGPNRILLHQGANAGFRSMFMHCFHGPDVGKGFNMHVNAELNGVFCICEVAQLVLKELKMEGVDLSKFQKNFSLEGVPTEEIVNIGYKELVFKSFMPDLPEVIEVKGHLDPLSPFNLAVGGTLVSATNQGFARASNMLSDREPVWDPELFGRQGKIMDSWETVRHNEKPVGDVQDICVFTLKTASEIKYVFLSTKYHLGNQAEHVRVDGRSSITGEWLNLVPKTHMAGHSTLKLIAKPHHGVKFATIRVSIYPDGGFTRIGLFNDLPASEVAKFKPIGEAVQVPFTELPPMTLKPLAPVYTLPSEQSVRQKWASLRNFEVDAASLVMGGSIASCSNQHYGPAIQIISPYPPMSMFDGVENSRSRVKGNSENVVVKLGKTCTIKRIEVDCTYFVNNSPLELRIEGTKDEASKDGWVTLVGQHRVKHFKGNCMIFFPGKEFAKEDFAAVRFTMYPCGGFNRVRVFTQL